MNELTKKIALVTGATRGIGAATALELAKNNYLVIGTATSEAGADKIRHALQEYHGKGVCLDVTDQHAAKQLIDQIVKDYGSIDVLVNNAGITKDGLAMRLKDEEWDAVLNTNLKAVFHLCQAVIRPMMKQRYGRIINITSVVGSTGNAGQINYSAAKAGVAGLTRTLAHEVASRGITVNAIAPGFIATDMTKDLAAEHQQALLTKIPLGKLGAAKDIAFAVAFLADARASYITGQELHVNGGMYML